MCTQDISRVDWNFSLVKGLKGGDVVQLAFLIQQRIEPMLFCHIPNFRDHFCKKVILLLIHVCVVLCSATAVSAQAIKIFILHSYHQEYPWTKNENTGFVEKIGQEFTNQQVVITTENLDTKRVKFDREYQEFFFKYLQHKFSRYQPDLIFSTDDNALSFLLNYKSRLFRDVPVVFCGVNNLAVGEILDRDQYTGVFEKKEIIPNLDLLKNVNPDLDKIIFVGDNSSTHLAITEDIRLDMKAHSPELEYEILGSNKLSELIGGLATRKKVLIFLTSIGEVSDSSGNVLPLQRTIEALAHAGDYKIISMEDVYIQEAVLGGYVTSGVAQGASAAVLASHVLQGTPVSAVALERQSPNVYMFNYPQLQRFELAVGNLPEKSLILNKPQSFYEQYRYHLWGSLLFVIFQSGVIFLLITNITRRKKSDQALHQANAELEQKVGERTHELEKAYSDLKSTQSQMLQGEKMASIGQLAAGVAHEINNPIGFISSNLTTLKKYIDRLAEYVGALSQTTPVKIEPQIKELRKTLKIDYILEDGKDLIEESLDGTDRISNIVKGLKSFSRVDDAKQAPADINQCLESTINIIWNELKYKATIEKEYAELPLTHCYPQQLNQVFMNILMNAAQAIEGKGVIGVKTWQQGENIFVAISDSGAGIKPENLPKLFEPFFTTKTVGKGTGLGLSISYDIIKKHNGKLTVQSEVGRGTTFTICIPAV